MSSKLFVVGAVNRSTPSIFSREYEKYFHFVVSQSRSCLRYLKNFPYSILGAQSLRSSCSFEVFESKRVLFKVFEN
ncbi:hypothetical protein SDJN03_23551, partial [Cucurbita argyrosperma subsp. sororia]